MNLLVYLVYSRDKTFDMHSLRAFKSLKAYKFFYDENVWVYKCPCANDMALSVVFLCFCLSLPNMRFSFGSFCGLKW